MPLRSALAPPQVIGHGVHAMAPGVESVAESQRAKLAVAGIVSTVSFAILWLRFAIPQPVGLADNGDGIRLTCDLNLVPAAPVLDAYVQTTHVHSASSCAGLAPYGSSQELFLDAAAHITRLLGLSSGLDLTVLLVIEIAAVAAAIGLLALFLPLRRLGRIIAAGAVLLVMLDSAFFGFFASTYSDAAGFIGMLIILPGIFAMHVHRTRLVGWALVIVGGSLAVSAKAEALGLLVPLFLLLAAARVPLRRMPSAVLPFIGALMIIGSAAAGLSTTNGIYPHINAYNVAFVRIVDGHHDTKADLRALGLPPSYARYAGQSWFTPHSAAATSQASTALRRITLAADLRYDATHPLRTLGLLNESAREVLQMRPTYLGNYTAGHGEPAYAEEDRVGIVSSLLRTVARLGLVALIVVWSVLGSLAYLAVRDYAPGSARRTFGVVIGFLTVASIVEFFVVALTEGIETTKHGVFATLPLALAGVFAIAHVAACVRRPLEVG